MIQIKNKIEIRGVVLIWAGGQMGQISNAGAALGFQIDGAKTFFSPQNRKNSSEHCAAPVMVNSVYETYKVSQGIH